MFEIAKSQMAKLQLFDGIKANLFASTQEMGPRNDSLEGNEGVVLPEFIG